jgi:hypothetical protein
VTEHTGDGTTVAFTFTGYTSTADGAYLVSVGGIDQPPSKYSVSNTAGGTITFVDAPVTGELISIRAIVSSGGGGGSGDATSIQGRPVLDQAPDEKMSLTWVSGNWQPSFTTDLAGVPLGSPFQPTSGNLLRFDGTNWLPFDGLAVPNWQTGQAYSLGDKVYYEGIIYINRGTSSATNPAADPSNWDQASGGSSSPGPSDSVNVAYWMRFNFEGAYSYIPVYR